MLKKSLSLFSSLILLLSFSFSFPFFASADTTVWSCSMMDYSCGGEFDETDTASTVPTEGVGTVISGGRTGILYYNTNFSPAPLVDVSCVSADITKVNTNGSAYEGILLADVNQFNTALGWVSLVFNRDQAGTVGLAEKTGRTITYYDTEDTTPLDYATHNWKLCVDNGVYSGYIDNNLIISVDLSSENHTNNSFGAMLYGDDYFANYLITSH